jgi:hypothetical protein
MVAKSDDQHWMAKVHRLMGHLKRHSPTPLAAKRKQPTGPSTGVWALPPPTCGKALKDVNQFEI